MFFGKKEEVKEEIPRRKNYMRNKPCPCNSGKKFKKCCWSRLASYNNGSKKYE